MLLKCTELLFFLSFLLSVMGGAAPGITFAYMYTIQYLCITLRSTNNSLIALTILNLVLILGNLHIFHLNKCVLNL